MFNGDSEASTWGANRAVVAPKVIVTVFPGRTVTITFTSTNTRYQRLNFTNTGESGGGVRGGQLLKAGDHTNLEKTTDGLS